MNLISYFVIGFSFATGLSLTIISGRGMCKHNNGMMFVVTNLLAAINFMMCIYIIVWVFL